jgi:hypothetical protein
MKTIACMLLVALGFLCSVPAPAHQVRIPGPGGASGGVTWTVVQHPNNFTCAPTGSGNKSCSVTSSATAAGNLLILLSSAWGTNGKPTFVSASGDGTWTHFSAANAFINYTGTTWVVTDGAYILSATGGATTETFTWNYPGGTTDGIDVELIEVQRSTGTATFDAQATGTNAGCSHCVAPSVSVSGSSDYIVQWVAFSLSINSISSPYSNPFDPENTNVQGAFAGALNQSSGTGPTWTMSGGGAAALSGVAFK